MWKQYMTEKSIREVLATIYACDAVQIGDNEVELYATLKRHLTKKELRLFIMLEAGTVQAEVAAELKMDESVFEKARHKTYSKVRSNKVQDTVRTIHSDKKTDKNI